MPDNTSFLFNFGVCCELIRIKLKRELKISLSKKSVRKALSNVFQIFLWVLIAIFFALALRIFFLASFKIPSPSMEPAIMPGDFILVNKLIPGPRVYKNFDFTKGAKVETRRFKGIRKIKRNDVLVFNFPRHREGGGIDIALNVNYVKRCIAVPGDSFYIENGIYKVKGTSEVLGHLPHQQSLSRMERERFQPEIWNTFPFDTTHYDWNVKDFGSVYIPGAGDILEIDTLNYRLYRNLISYETDKPLVEKDGAVYLGDSLLSNYTFRQNYYFMSGDWVSDSQDSRYWGLLPEDHIIGKAIVVWKSKDMHSGKYNWKRFFKIIK